MNKIYGVLCNRIKDIKNRKETSLHKAIVYWCKMTLRRTLTNAVYPANHGNLKRIQALILSLGTQGAL